MEDNDAVIIVDSIPQVVTFFLSFMLLHARTRLQHSSIASESRKAARETVASLSLHPSRVNISRVSEVVGEKKRKTGRMSLNEVNHRHHHPLIMRAIRPLLYMSAAVS